MTMSSNTIAALRADFTASREREEEAIRMGFPVIARAERRLQATVSNGVVRLNDLGERTR